MSWFKIRCTIPSYAFGFSRLGGEFLPHPCKKEHVPFCLLRFQQRHADHGRGEGCSWEGWSVAGCRCCCCSCSQPGSVKAWPLLGTDSATGDQPAVPFAHSHCLWPVQHGCLLHGEVQRANKICPDIPSSHPFPSNQIGLVTTFGWQVCKIVGSLRQSQCDLISLYRTQQNEALNLICSL